MNVTEMTTKDFIIVSFDDSVKKNRRKRKNKTKNTHAHAQQSVQFILLSLSLDTRISILDLKRSNVGEIDSLVFNFLLSSRISMMRCSLPHWSHEKNEVESCLTLCRCLFVIRRKREKTIDCCRFVILPARARWIVYGLLLTMTLSVFERSRRDEDRQNRKRRTRLIPVDGIVLSIEREREKTMYKGN